MARVFLDANIVIDLVEERQDISIEQLRDHKLFSSPLSLHILSYIYKHKMPEEKLSDFAKQMTITSIYQKIVDKSLIGPTQDFEDNIQLHSAAEVKCDIFLTSDKQLQKLIYFGKVKLAAEL